ncbi:nuclear transport factor 2 family protein [Thermomonas brevis]
MQQSRGIQRFAMAAGMAAMLCIGACAKQGAEAEVRARIAELQAAIDARSAGDVHDLLAEDFVGNDGLDRRGARQLAAGSFLRYRDVSVRLGPVDVELRGERDAVASFTAAATGGSGAALPDSGQLYQVETGWRLIDGKWQLLNASWKPAF